MSTSLRSAAAGTLHQKGEARFVERSAAREVESSVSGGADRAEPRFRSMPAVPGAPSRSGRDAREQERRAGRIRIALVAPGPRLTGGQQAQASALAQELTREGFPVRLVPIDPTFPPGLGWVRRLPYLRTVLNTALYLPSLRAMRRADVALVFSASYWSFLLAPVPAILACRALGCRAILVYHSGEAEDHLARWGRRVHPWLRLAHDIVVPSEYLRDVFARHGFTARVIPNVVPTSRFPYRERRPLRPRLLSTRSLERIYRVDNTLRAFALLERRYPEATLTLAGSGREEASLRRLAARLGCKGVRFAGRVEPSAIPRLCDGSDIWVNSSEVDNQPVSVLEAFASGLPVVTTAPGGIARLVRNGETGLIVPPGDPGEMARAVASLVESPDRARDLARRARAEVEAHTWDRVRDLWAEACGAAA